MSWTQTGADVATMFTGLSAVSAAYVWIRGQVREQRERRAARQLRDWSAYVDVTTINTWHVRLADDDAPGAKVSLEVIDNPGGEGSETQAYALRQIVSRDGLLSRSPTPDEHAFLRRLQKERRRNGVPVR